MATYVRQSPWQTAVKYLGSLGCCLWPSMSLTAACHLCAWLRSNVVGQIADKPNMATAVR
jgi:hypothetical protein